ncbi:hypothetical protein ACFVMC_26910, partial [Nocardia sp. NPDC127579]
MSKSANIQQYRVDRLKPRAIGLFGVVFMAVATAAPIAAMTGNVPASVALGNGVGAPAAFVVATVVLTIFAVGYIAMSRYITTTGAFYGYVSHGLGRVPGLAAGLLAVLAYMVFEASLVVGRHSICLRRRRFECMMSADDFWCVPVSGLC